MLVLGGEPDDISRAQLGCRSEQRSMVALQKPAMAERLCVDHCHTATTDVHTRDLHGRFFVEQPPIHFARREKRLDTGGTHIEVTVGGGAGRTSRALFSKSLASPGQYAAQERRNFRNLLFVERLLVLSFALLTVLRRRAGV